MSTLSWNEIRTRATTFAKEWEDEKSEDAEAKSFWDGFFDVFGVARRRLATFEQPVKKGDQKQGFIDLLWKGVILVEHKSRGRDLDKAFTQAKDYFPGLDDGDLPKYILVSDFARFRLYDLDAGTREDFDLAELSRKVELFGFMAGYQKRIFLPEDPVNIKAAEYMGKLHDSLKDIGYTGHELEVYLVRILFCLFAEDTSIFERKLFQEYIETKTNPDGSDLAYHISALFQILNTPREKRLKNLDESLDAFPYVNGKLFEEVLSMASFDRLMRERLLTCCRLDWSGISPAIFGSLFQNVMDEKARRNLGAHYTSEKNIMKLISPLFLDDLWSEFESIRSDKKKLEKFHDKLGTLTFLDPACGCGNFLVITYRELRKLETAVIKALYRNQQVLDVAHLIRVNVDQFYGIEIEEFPSQIAPVAMWLVDHQMNMEVSQEFGEYFVRLPLSAHAMIVHANALTQDWKEVIAPENLSYIIGNPPFNGSRMMDEGQKIDLTNAVHDIKEAGFLDFVAGWYIKAIDYIQDNKSIQVAFVSTNSISQGEQVGILWEYMLSHGAVINSAHQTFRWSNDAKGNAAVYCIIVAFGLQSASKKRLFVYDKIGGDPHETIVKNINPYLVEGPNVLVRNRQKPLCNVPDISFGNMPRDGGNLILSPEERKFLINKYPHIEKYIRLYIGAEELINKGERYCLWLVDVNPSDLRNVPEILQRIENNRNFRLASKAASTRKMAETPMLFAQRTQVDSDYLAIPKTSSERRTYIPIGFLRANVITTTEVFMLNRATLFHFGILTSMMHMAWVRYTCGRLKSDYRYSKDIVYNNFPWPEVSEKDKDKIEKLAQAVLDARAEFPNASLADLYDPRTMPPALVRAHSDLDKAVDKLYRPSGFASDIERVEWLFGIWEKLTK